MNEATVSFIRALFKISSGALIAKGVGDSELWEAVGGGLLAGVTIWWGCRSKKESDSRQLKLPLLFLFLIVAPTLVGCVNMSKLVKQLKDDPATVDVSVQTIYGSFLFHRAFPTNCQGVAK